MRKRDPTIQSILTSSTLCMSCPLSVLSIPFTLPQILSASLLTTSLATAVTEPCKDSLNRRTTCSLCRSLNNGMMRHIQKKNVSEKKMYERNVSHQSFHTCESSKNARLTLLVTTKIRSLMTDRLRLSHQRRSCPCVLSCDGWPE